MIFGRDFRPCHHTATGIDHVPANRPGVALGNKKTRRAGGDGGYFLAELPAGTYVVMAQAASGVV